MIEGVADDRHETDAEPQQQAADEDEHERHGTHDLKQFRTRGDRMGYEDSEGRTAGERREDGGEHDNGTADGDRWRARLRLASF